jgi:F0F1-type ATP synthase membrane subunit b/b'
MDPTTLHDLWVNLATNSPFLGFLLYNWWAQNKQNEAYRQEIKDDRTAYDKKREEDIEKIRDRYSVVISELRQEREDYRLEMERIREKCEKEKNQLLTDMLRKIERVSERLEK